MFTKIDQNKIINFDVQVCYPFQGINNKNE